MLRVAVLGCGSVGLQVVRLLHEQAGDLTARGRPVELVGIAVRRLDAPRDIDVPEVAIDGRQAPRPGDVELVIEVIGGIEPVRAR